MFDKNTSVLLPATTVFSTVASDLVVSPNNLYCLMFNRLSSKDANFKLLATYQVPAEALNTDSFV